MVLQALDSIGASVWQVRLLRYMPGLRTETSQCPRGWDLFPLGVLSAVFPGPGFLQLSSVARRLEHLQQREVKLAGLAARATALPAGGALGFCALSGFSRHTCHPNPISSVPLCLPRPTPLTCSGSTREKGQCCYLSLGWCVWGQSSNHSVQVQAGYFPARLGCCSLPLWRTYGWCFFLGWEAEKGFCSPDRLAQCVLPFLSRLGSKV